MDSQWRQSTRTNQGDACLNAVYIRCKALWYIGRYTYLCCIYFALSKHNEITKSFYLFQAYEFLLFAGLMFIDMFIFTLMAMRYKYVEPKKAEDDTSKPEDEQEPNGNSIPLKEKENQDWNKEALFLRKSPNWSRSQNRLPHNTIQQSRWRRYEIVKIQRTAHFYTSIFYWAILCSDELLSLRAKNSPILQGL